MGAVYECVHLTTQKHRALKVMLPAIIAQPALRERFELEARVTAKIESDHIVETFDAAVDEATGAPFLVMELLRGDDLDSLLARRGRFGAEETVLLLSQAALALEKTHAAGIVHRDLKPQNLFLTMRDDGSPRLKILDFGIAKVVADATRPTRQTATVGTPLYMSPEQIAGDGRIGPASDLYALANISYALLVGDSFWAEEERTLDTYPFLTRVLEGVAERPTARAERRGVLLPPGFDAWFGRATARQPSARFDRAGTQMVELAAALGVPAPRVSLVGPALAPMPGWTSSADAYAPTSATPAPGTPAVSDGRASAGAPPSSDQGSVGTIGPVSRKAAPPFPRPSSDRTSGIAIAMGAAVVLVMVGTVLASRLLYGARRPPAAAYSAALEAAPAPSPTPPGSGSAPPAETSATRPGAVVSATAVAPSSRLPPGTGRNLRGPVQASPAADHDRRCDPPFDLDGAGHRHLKPECL
jgi:serine/threonine-protein kinase